MEELQSWWEIPSIGQYVSLFRFDFKLPEMDLDELEEGLIADAGPGGSPFIENLIVSLIRGIYPRAGVNEQNWEFHLKRLLQKKWVKQEERTNPISEETPFNKATLREKVEIIHSLCYYRLESGDVQDHLKSMDADNLRVQSLGCDDLGNVYWYFYGTRLYKEEPCKEKKKDWQEEWKKQKQQSFGEKRRRGRPRKRKLIKSDGESEESEENDPKNGCMNLNAKSRWSVVCTTLEEWVDFTEKFKKSKSKSEMALFKLLSTNFLPHLNDMYEEKEKRLKQKLMELIPRRVSTRIETRKRTRSEHKRSNYSESNGYQSDDEFKNQSYEKEKLSRDRAQRLEERNQRRISEQINRSRSNSLKRNSWSADRSENDSDDESPERPEVPMPSSNNKTDMRFKIHQVITEVKMCKDAWPFLYPVEESYAPGYYSIISEPMDLSAIENKLITGVYKSLSEVDNDFRKMVSNCQLYNGEKSDFSTMAVALWKIFRKGISKLSRNNPPQSTTPAEPEAARSSPSEPELVDENSTSSDSLTSKASEKLTTRAQELQTKRKKKKKQIPGLQALNMLAKASEMALKNTTREESSSYSESISESSSDSSYKPTSAFSDLNIVPIHTPQVNKSISPHDVHSITYSNHTSADQQTQYDSIELQDQDYEPASDQGNINNNYSESTYNPNALNVLANSNANDSFNSSNENMDVMVSEADKAASFSRQRTSPIHLLNTVDNQISTILAECNSDNMTNLLSKFINDNEKLMDTQNVDMPSSQEATNNANSMSISPRLESSVKVAYSRNSPISTTSQVFSTQTFNNSLQEGIGLQPSLGNFQLSNEISTVDASALGLSNTQSFEPRVVNGTNCRMPIYSNAESKKGPMTISSLLAGIQTSTVASSPSSKKQRCSPIYVTVNANRPNLLTVPSTFAQPPNNVINAGFVQEYPNQQTNFVQGSLPQLTNITMQSPNQNFIVQGSRVSPPAAINSVPLQVPQAFNKVCAEQNSNAFMPNQLSQRQLTMSNGQIMILTPTSVQASPNGPATLNFLQTSGNSYQPQVYNSATTSQISPTILVAENQSPTSKSKNLSRPPKKRSPIVEPQVTSVQISPTASEPPNCNTNSNVSYSPPVQAFLNSKNSPIKSQAVDPNQDFLRNSVIMPNISQGSQSLFTNSGNISVNGHKPTYVSSPMFPTVVPQQQIPRMMNFNSNHAVGGAPLVQKVVIQNGKTFKPANIMKNKNGQYILVSAVKDGVSSQVGEAFPQLQSFSNPSTEVRPNAPQYININNTLVQTVPLQGFKSAPGLPDASGNQVTHFINIPHYIMATQSPTVIQQPPPLYTQSVNSINQKQQPMENR